MLDAIQTIGHFHSAKAFDTAASVLVLSLNAFLREKKAREDFGLTSVWVGVGIPGEVDMKARLFIRALQASALQKLGKNSDEMLADLDALLDRAGNADQLGVFGACATIAVHFPMDKPAIATRYAVRAVINAGAMKQIRQKPKKRLLEVSSLIWVCGAACRNSDDVEMWLTEIGKLGPEERKTLFSRSLISDSACQTICDGLWLRESDKPEDDRDWTKILNLLVRVKELGQAWASNILWASAVRAEIVVRAEYLDQLEVAARLAEASLSMVLQDEEDAVFLVSESIGRQYRQAGDWENAATWLKQATQGQSDSFAFLRMRAMLELGIVEGRTNKEAALLACRRAVGLARRSKSLSDLHLTEALGEEAIASWHFGNREGAFACWDEAARKLLDRAKRDEQWKSLLGMFGHATGFFSALFSGLEPKPASEYVVPEPGWFVRDRTRVSEIHDPKKEWMVAAHLSMMAEGIGEIEMASEWALRALDMGRKGDEGGMSESFAMYAIAAAVGEDRYADALELARGALSNLMLTGVKGKRGPIAEPTEEELVYWQKRTTAFGVVPAGFRLASLWLKDLERCKSLVSNLVLKCRQFAQGSNAPDVWEKTADAIEEVFSEGCNAEVLLEKSKSLAEKDEPAPRILFFLGAILHSGPKRSYALQLGLYPYLEETYKRYGIYRQNMVSFLLDFWRQSIQAEPYVYKQPGLLKDKFEEIEKSGMNRKEKTLLLELSWSLATKPNADMQQWLDKS